MVKNKIVFSLIALLLMFSSISFAAAERVDNIQVEIVDLSQNANNQVLERMSSSMNVVANQMMIGKPLTSLEENQDAYTLVLKDISDRVFAGYKTENVTMQVGTTTNIKIYVTPWADITKEVKINLYLSGIDVFWEDLLQKDIQDLNNEVKEILTGISVDSVDWTSALVKERVRETVEKELPFFKATVDVVGGETVSVDIILIPVGSSVKGVKYQLTSNTIPNILLIDTRKKLGDYTGKLRGLPIDFLVHHKVAIEDKLKAVAQKEYIVEEFKLDVEIDILPKEDSEVDIKFNSGKYQVWIEGYADLSRDNENISGKIHLGRFISKRDEIFLETALYTKNMKWTFDPGVSRRFGQANVSLLYRLPDNEKIFRLEYDFFKKWRLRMEKNTGYGRMEYALRYRIHEFLVVEFVFGADKENYLRIVGNL